MLSVLSCLSYTCSPFLHKFPVLKTIQLIHFFNELNGPFKVIYTRNIQFMLMYIDMGHWQFQQVCLVCAYSKETLFFIWYTYVFIYLCVALLELLWGHYLSKGHDVDHCGYNNSCTFCGKQLCIKHTDIISYFVSISSLFCRQDLLLAMR